MKFFIAAGHFPEKAGACHEGFCEWDEANEWVKIMESYLVNAGKKINENFFIVPPNVVALKTSYVNSRCSKKDIFVEVHFNSAAMSYHTLIEGCETLYYPTSVRGKKVAKVLQNRMLDAYDLKDRGIKEGWYQQKKSKGIIYTLRGTRCTTVILEPEFIQHKEKIQAMREPVSKAVVDGLLELEKTLFD